MKYNLSKRVKNLQNFRLYKNSKQLLERNVVNQSTEMPKIKNYRQKNYSTVGVNYKSLQENVNNPNTIQSISRNIEYNTEGNHENSISVNKGSPERALKSRTSRTGMTITHRSKSTTEKVDEKKVKTSYINDSEHLEFGPLVYEKEIILVDIHTYIQRLNDKMLDRKSEDSLLTDYSAFFNSK